MPVQLPITILCLLLHGGICLTSERGDRRLRFVAGIVLVLLAWPLAFTGGQLAGAGAPLARWAALVLGWAPWYLPPLSFLVYRRR